MAESKPRVLLVEDTRSLAVVYEQYLAQDGYEVQLADCGQQALAQLLASPPPVVLLDLMMPGMDGGTLARLIRAGRLSSVMGKAVVKTAQAIPKDRLCFEHALRFGAWHVGAHP